MAILYLKIYVLKGQKVQKGSKFILLKLFTQVSIDIYVRKREILYN